SPSMRRPVGVKWVLPFFGSTKLFSRRAATVATLPSALIESDSRSVQVGCFSFQPVLPPDYRPPVPFSRNGSWARRLTQSPELGAWAFAFCFLRNVLPLCCCRHRSLIAVAQRLVYFSAHPFQTVSNLPRSISLAFASRRVLAFSYQLSVGSAFRIAWHFLVGKF